jgi:hypothetical protein
MPSAALSPLLLLLQAAQQGLSLLQALIPQVPVINSLQVFFAGTE